MLKQIADGVLVHQSEFLQSNAIVVQGRAGVLLIDPGVQDHELACLADDLSTSDQTVVAGFSTHPHWDHVLWHARFGAPPRYGTARCAATVQEELTDPGAKAAIVEHLAETEIAGKVPLDLYGLVTALPAGTTQVPWDGPQVRIIEHQAHAPGHAALVIAERGVLVAGDMLSDVLIPMLDLYGAAADPVEDYLAALRLLEDVAAGVDVVVPGHGSVGGADEVRARIERDRAYVHALRDGRTPDDHGSAHRPSPAGSGSATCTTGRPTASPRAPEPRPYTRGGHASDQTGEPTMTVPVPDLPPPHDLWAEPAMLSALTAGRPASIMPGYDLTADGLRMRDIGNGWWALLPVTGGRAVLYGLDLDNSEIELCREPVDLLAGGPAWLPWPRLQALLASEVIGFMYWWDGAAWSRALYPPDLREDGCRILLEEAATALASAVEQLTDSSADRQHVLARLRAAAHSRTADLALFAAVEHARTSAQEPAIDPGTALEAATRAGLTPGGTWPEHPAGDGEPAGRTVPFNGPDQHAALVERVMRSAPEQPRPAPADGDALRDLTARLRADGTAVLTVQCGPRHRTSFSTESGQVSGALADLVTALREADADPDSGRWLYLRVDVTGPSATVQRAYDHVPDWWRPPYPSVGVPLLLLREEIAGRTEQWRPQWTALLDASLARSGVPAHLCRPAAPPGT
ncbi:MBL fold metallo-hydrolase [Dactylosporangium sp. NPDC000521]|uniref:MBL fold metallo-hydrolase n=1 Tax=Dactylosporangium sp. NPDC000521 TaxID=3363975 RepID=UPI003686FCEE